MEFDYNAWKTFHNGWSSRICWVLYNHLVDIRENHCFAGKQLKMDRRGKMNGRKVIRKGCEFDEIHMDVQRSEHMEQLLL